MFRLTNGSFAKYTRAGIVAVAIVGSGLVATTRAGDPAAGKMIESVHKARANWNGIEGFTCDLRVFAEGRIQEGVLTVSADGESKLEGIEMSSERGVLASIRSLISHRFPSNDDFEDATLADEQSDHPLGRLINLNDGTHSQFRIAGDAIREVHRNNNERGSFTITAIELYRNPEGKHLPKVYTITFWDKDGKLTSTGTVHDEWVRVGRWDLPKSHTSVRSSDGKQDVARVEFTNHKLLSK